MTRSPQIRSTPSTLAWIMITRDHHPERRGGRRNITQLRLPKSTAFGCAFSHHGGSLPHLRVASRRVSGCQRPQERDDTARGRGGGKGSAHRSPHPRGSSSSPQCGRLGEGGSSSWTGGSGVSPTRRQAQDGNARRPRGSWRPSPPPPAHSLRPRPPPRGRPQVSP